MSTVPAVSTEPSNLASAHFMLPRRAFLGASLASLVAGCGSNNPAPPKLTPENEFNALVDKIQLHGFAVRESEFHGERTIVIFADYHNQPNAARVELTITDLQNKIRNFEFLSIEGLIHGNDPSIKDEVTRLVNQKILVSDSLVINEADKIELARLLRIPMSALQPPLRTQIDSDTRSRFYRGLGAPLVGIEQNSINDAVDFAIISVLCREYERFDAMSQAAKHSGSGRLIKFNDKWIDEEYARIFQLQNDLRIRFLDLPILDVQQLDLLEGKLAYTGNRWHKHFEETFKNFGLWLRENNIGDRNKFAANIIDEEFKLSGARFSGLVFGALHTVEGGGKGHAVQKYLGELGISYIVIDPLPITLIVGQSGYIDILK